jgi:hypothetical protein
LIAFSFGEFPQLNALGEIAFDTLNSPSKSVAIQVPKYYWITGGCCHLGDPMAHRACADDAHRLNPPGIAASFQGCETLLC